MMHAPSPRGYTLIELIVSVAIFSIVMLIATAAFLALISIDRKARATNDVVTNLSYVVDSMQRTIRTGTNYENAVGTSQFTFTDTYGSVVTYRLAVTSGRGSIEQCIGSTCMALTDPRVDIESVFFHARGTTLTDSRQPVLYVSIRGLITPDPQSPPVEIVLQSGATQRLIDIDL